MGEFKPTDMGQTATTVAFTLLVPPPASGTFVIESGGLVIQNTTTTDHNLIIEIRRGTTVVKLYDNDLFKKETMIWDHIIRIPSDFTGIFFKTTVAPATPLNAYYTGTLSA